MKLLLEIYVKLPYILSYASKAFIVVFVFNQQPLVLS